MNLILSKFIYICLIFLSFDIYSEELIKLDQLYIEGEKTVLSNRSYFLKNPEDVDKAVNLTINLKLGDLAYNSNEIVSLTDSNQFRFVGLESEIGLNFKRFDVYFRHWSGHALDFEFGQRFPEDNVIGIRFYLYGGNLWVK